jgi:hypothetical protein
MHFFRIQIRRHRNQRPPSQGTEQDESTTISGRNIREPPLAIPQKQVRNSLWQFLPSIGKVS